MAERYTPGSVWTRTAKAKQSARPTLDRKQIVRAAIEVLDAEGLDGLTMRKLGAKLDVAATTMYWHVASREELLDLAFDEVLGELHLPVVDGKGKNWRTELTRVYVDLRDLIQRHPWFAALHGTRPYSGPNGTRFYAAEIDALKAAGASGATLDNALWALGNYAVGASATLTSWDAWLDSDPAEVETARRHARDAVQPYPNFKEHVETYLEVADSADMREGRFTFGLECLFDGIAARIRAAKRA